MRQAVRIENLCLRFGEQAILHDIQLSVPQNSITVLAGRSGCGKSTLLRTMNRFNEEYGPCATRGLVQVDIGHGLQTVDDDAGALDIPLQTLRQKVAMVFQTPQLLPVGIARNISMPLELALGLPRKQSAARVQAALELVGLWNEVRDRLDSAAGHLSGGQQQRLCLARALALEPRILLLDEPTGSLDIHAAAAIEALLLRLKQQYTIVLVSHSVEQGCRLADQIIVMERGRIKARIDHDTRHCAPELTRLIEG